MSDISISFSDEKTKEYKKSLQFAQGFMTFE